MLVKCVITSLDNLPLLKEQITILRNKPVDEIIVVNNGSEDGTAEWLATQSGLTVINRENNGAGPGRNAGLDMAGRFDYVLMLDGGIRLLLGGTQKMIDYLERRQGADVIGVEIADFETDPERAWRRWPKPIRDEDTYQNLRLSHTAYCLARFRAFDGLRFSEEGPFGEAGWGCDDDQMAYQWRDAGIVVHVVTNIHPYRRGSGSFGRLFRETGIWPNQFGSTYEKRLVWLQQNYAQYQPGIQWGEAPPERTVIIDVADLEETINFIKFWHDEFRKDRQPEPWQAYWLPYRIEVRCPVERTDFLEWAELRRLRQHHGDTIIVDGEIIRRNSGNEELWTGDFILEVI
jgi:glycosyltransferase involved in cell wall biosynthesis